MEIWKDEDQDFFGETILVSLVLMVWMAFLLYLDERTGLFWGIVFIGAIVFPVYYTLKYVIHKPEKEMLEEFRIRISDVCLGKVDYETDLMLMKKFYPKEFEKIEKELENSKGDLIKSHEKFDRDFNTAILKKRIEHIEKNLKELNKKK